MSTHLSRLSGSELRWPEHTNTHHSTQFSFDDSQIGLNHLICSPSLSKRMSMSPALTSPLSACTSPSATERDVVEALALMESGSFVIVLSVDNLDGQSVHNSLDWNMVTLSNRHDNMIQIHSPKPTTISLHDIVSVSTVDDDTISNVMDTINISGVQTVGLQSLSLCLKRKDELPDILLIFEEYHTAYIWKRGLETLLRTMCRGEPVITTIAFCCSSLDRINNEQMHSRMSIDDLESTTKWIAHIQSALPLLQKQIERTRVFTQKCCILDSSEHLSLLLRTNALTALSMDAKRLSALPIYQLTKEEKFSLREVWLSLLADLTVVMLKEHQLRGDMTASTQVPDMEMLQTTDKSL